MIQPPYTFRRLGALRPPTYAVESPADYLGEVVAVDPGRPGQSRSANRYHAHPVGRRGYAMSLAILVTPDGYALGKRGTAFASRREAADALLAYLREAGR